MEPSREKRLAECERIESEIEAFMHAGFAIGDIAIVGPPDNRLDPFQPENMHVTIAPPSRGLGGR